MVLVLAGTFPLGLLVLVLAVVQDPADGRDGVRGDFDEVEVSLASSLQRLRERQDTKSLSVVPDDEDFAGANALVPTKLATYARTLALNCSIGMLQAHTIANGREGVN